VTKVSGSVRETSAEPCLTSLPMSHVSVELGHLYYEDFATGPDALTAMFSALTPWTTAASSRTAAGEPSGKVRISTCFLIDDYFSRFPGPAEVVPAIIEAAGKVGLRIDYFARESACVAAGSSCPAELVLGRLVTEPAPGTTGARPPVTESGWLTNGVRSPATPFALGAAEMAMRSAKPWTPPKQNAARRHSIFVDIELWDESGGQRVWSCAMLAAVWQSLRLGVLRDLGRPVAQPVDAPAEWPDSWADLPPVVRLRPDATPFTAYTTISLLSPRFLTVEVAVRTILGQFAADPPVLADLAERARREHVDLPEEIVDRVRYAFVNPGRIDPA
jgi:hypothetical protein